MAYCTYTSVQYATGSVLSQTILEEIIAQADKEINAKLIAAGLTPPTTDTILSAASLRLSSLGVMLRQKMVGQSVDAYSLDRTIDQLHDDAMEMVKQYIDYQSRYLDTWVKKVNY